MADAPKEPLSPAERKAKLPHGACTRVSETTGVDKSTVTKILYGDFTPRTRMGVETVKRVQVALARQMKLKVAEAFPPAVIRERAGV
jgi:alpha-D-ribose 1-methylphosphonate 5-triphosphate synthase subunit PhnL